MSHFQVGETVVSNTSHQGLVAGDTYSVVKVIQSSPTGPFGPFLTYRVKSLQTGKIVDVVNAHLVLGKMPQEPTRAKRKPKVPAGILQNLKFALRSVNLDTCAVAPEHQEAMRLFLSTWAAGPLREVIAWAEGEKHLAEVVTFYRQSRAETS